MVGPRRLAGEVLRRLGLSAEPPLPSSMPTPTPAGGGEDAAARIDAARERLRSTIAAPQDERDG